MSETCTSEIRPSATAPSMTTEDTEDTEDKETSGQDDVQHLSTSDTHSQDVVLCVVWKRGMLGAASYSVETSEVSVLADIVDVNPEFNILKSLYYQVQPSKVVTLSGLPDIFTSAVKALVNPGDEANLTSQSNITDYSTLIFLSAKECSACQFHLASVTGLM